MKTTFSVSMVIIFLCILLCKDSVVTPKPDAVDGFPLAVGSKWTYAIFYSVSQQADTVDVTIVSKNTISSTKVIYIWRYVYRD